MNDKCMNDKCTAGEAKVHGTVDAKAVRGMRSVAEMIIHSEGNLADLRRHNDMLRFMIRQLDGSDESEDSVRGESGAIGWNGRLDDATNRTSQELATQAALTHRLAELMGLEI